MNMSIRLPYRWLRIVEYRFDCVLVIIGTRECTVVFGERR